MCPEHIDLQIEIRKCTTKHILSNIVLRKYTKYIKVYDNKHMIFVANRCESGEKEEVENKKDLIK